MHALVALVNVALGNVGATVRYLPDPDGPPPAAGGSIAALARELEAGQVETLIVLGGNPAYDAPADLDFAARLGRAGTLIHLSHDRNETSALAAWHLPRAHCLEAWGDARAWNGTVSVAQPLIEPLFDGRSPIELLALAAGLSETKGYDLVRQAILPLVGSEGLAAGAARRDGRGQRAGRGRSRGGGGGGGDDATTTGWAGSPRAPKPSAQALELVFLPDRKVYDGRFANNAWLQELPDPITKLTWDNARWSRRARPTRWASATATS